MVNCNFNLFLTQEDLVTPIGSVFTEPNGKRKTQNTAVKPKA